MKLYQKMALIVAGIGLVGCGTPNAETNESPSTSGSPAVEQINSETEPDKEQTLADEFSLAQADFDEAIQEQSETVEINPSRLVVPSLEVDAPVIEVGQLENGQMGVPDDGEEVGWYEPGTMPGGSGNSVLAGHVDDLEGPAVFATLTEVEIGDQIFVYDESGEELIFEVDRIESYPFDDAPLSEIFGRTDEQRLNLITCTGIYNPDTRNHDERLVVYSKLVQEPDEEKIPSAPSQVAIQGDLLSWHAVRDEYIAGYRIYELDEEGEEIHLASVAQTERKTVLIEDKEKEYLIKTVDYFGMESEGATLAEDDEEENDE